MQSFKLKSPSKQWLLHIKILRYVTIRPFRVPAKRWNSCSLIADH